MPFERQPPEPLVTDQLVIRPQRAGDNEPDYQAVMANRQWLRRWSGSSWPSDGFDLDDNLHSLAEHVIEHRKQIAYGFTIATDDAVLGSLYLNEISTLTDSYRAGPEVAEPLASARARADIWARLDQGQPLLDAVVAEAVAWLEASDFAPLVWCVRLGCPELERAYAGAGLEPAGRVTSDSGRVQLIYRLRRA